MNSGSSYTWSQLPRISLLNVPRKKKSFVTMMTDPLVVFQLVFVLLIALNPSAVSGFNLETQNIVTHTGAAGSMFGFSIAQHKDSNISWILVGAPNDDPRQQPGVRRPGSVYRCSCESSNTCQLLPFDRLGNNQVNGKQIDEKSYQWFGATVKTSGEDGIILACAPRYTWFSTNGKRRDPVGTCYVAKDSFTEFVEYSPCRTSRWGYHRQGSCQVGLGADIDPAGRRLFLGAVGSWYWQGQVYMVDSRKSADGNSLPFYQFRNAGQVYSQGLATRPDIRWTREGPNWDDDSYLGYSVAAGEFSGDKDSDVVVGMPRGANLTGKVVVYSSDLTNLHNITGEQIGSYFGYTVGSLDIDGDGLDDILIGAPMHTDFGDPAMKIETGKVYVVYQTKKHKFKHWEAVEGTVHRGRFGMAIASMGDINKDGFGDFAVGAPYGGTSGRGAVYIYQGSANGLRKEATQVIQAEELSQPIQTFGFSLSGGKDLDGNGYPDLLVGAYDSDFVAYFKSRPVVRVNCKLTFNSADQHAFGGSELSSRQVNLEEKNCRLRDGTQVTCLPVNLCMEYDGEGVDDTIDFEVQYILDSKKAKEPRMFFLNQEGRATFNETMRLFRKRQSCANYKVYLKPQIKDKLTSLEADFRYSMTRETIVRQRRTLPPIIDETTSGVEKQSVSIQKNCGSDDVCVPDLQVKATMSEASFLMGSSERINIEVEVDNNGEDSYESTLYMTVPSTLSYVSLDRLDTNKKVPNVLCSPPSPSSNNTLRCDIGNPLPRFTRVKFKLYFQPRHGSELKSDYRFDIVVNSTNPEQNELARADNLKSLVLPVRIQTDLGLFGGSRPQQVRNNFSQYQEENIIREVQAGPEVVHTYEIKCNGPSHVEEAELVLLWPSYTVDGEHFLYLMETHTEGPMTCSQVDDLNPQELIVSRASQFAYSQNRATHADSEDTYSSTASSAHHGSSAGSSSYGGSSSSSSSSSTRHASSSYGSSSSGSGSSRSTTSSRPDSTPVYGRAGNSGIVGAGTVNGQFRTGVLESRDPSRGRERDQDLDEQRTFHNSSYERAFGSAGGGSYSQTRSGVYRGRKQDERVFKNSAELDEYLRGQGFGGYVDGGYREQQQQQQTQGRRQFDHGSDPYFDSRNSVFPPQQRFKRQTGKQNWDKDLSCGPIKCVQIRCRVSELEAGQSVVLAVRARVWSRTLQTKYSAEDVNVSSKLLARVSKLPYNVDPSYLKYKTYEVVTTIVKETDLTQPAPVPWWVYFLAILAGLLLLLLIIYGLYKCGFFKRKRPRHFQGPDSQPLRNGYHDERL